VRRALAALVVTAAVVVALAGYRTQPRERPRTRAAAAPVPERLPAGARVADGIAINTPFTTIQVRATLTRGRLTGVKTLVLSSDSAHTRALNARAEPILRRRALQAHSAQIDVVSGATYTSRSWRMSLASAIAKARD
jgi:uncharacterized protein with FMN-binding domain